MEVDDVICSAYKECLQLKDAVHVIMVGDREVHQRPEYCSGRYPHRYRHEEDSGFFCSFVNKQVTAKRMYARTF